MQIIMGATHGKYITGISLKPGWGFNITFTFP